MKKVIPVLFSAMVYLLGSSLFAGEILTSEPQTRLTYLQSGFQRVSFRNTLHSVQFREVNTPLGIFTELFVKGYCNAAETGSPNLPARCRLIEVPANEGFEIRIISSAYTDYDLSDYGITHPVIPVQPSLSKGETNPATVPFRMNQALYNQNGFTGSALVSVSPAGILRDICLAQLTVSPLQYNPVTNHLRIYTSFEAEIIFKNPDLSSSIQLKKKYNSPYFRNLANLIDNYQSQYDSMITASPVTFVIVSPPEYQNALKPLIKWKTRKGFRVVEAYTNNPQVGSTTASIKSYLQNLYINPQSGYQPPSFILFVGDVAQIPAWTNNGQATDLRYCEYTGDNLPEVFYGRFSANNLSQLQPYVDKAVEYEKYAFPDDSFLNEDVMVAGYDAGGNGLTYGNGQINYGTAYYFNTAHNLVSHTYLQPEPSGANYSQQIRSNVSNGVCYANYTAHGSEDGWADPAFTISQIPALQNNHKYCLMVGNCCLTSRYNVNCFAEEVTRASGKGALGYIGASNNSLWDEDYWWGCGLKAVTTNPVYDPVHLGAYDMTFHDHGEAIASWFTTMSQMVVAGNLAVQQSNSGNKLYYWEIYNLMGDPSLSVYYSVPQPVSAVLPPVMLMGTNNCSVTTEPWAYVAISLNDSTLLDAKCADSSGVVILQYPQLTVPQYARFVITKQNRKPLIDSVLIIQPNGPYITLSSVSVNDSLTGNNNKKADFDETVALNVVVNNAGLAPANNLVAILSSQDTNILILSNSYTFGLVPSGAVATGTSVFSIKVKNNVTDQHKVHFTISFSDGTASWNYNYTMTLQAPLISIGNISVLDPLPGGNNNGIFDPGENVQIKVIISNSGHSPVSNVHGTMSVMNGSTGFVLLNNNSSFIGAVPVNGSGFAVFNAVANGITPAGTTVHFDFMAIAGQFNQYTNSDELSLVIGQAAQYPMTNSIFSACSGNFYDAGGPMNNYSNNQDLQTTIHAGNPGAKLRIIFSDFNVEPNANCGYDYLNIYNGPSMMDPLIGSFCGTQIPDTITSSSSVGSLTFFFHSDYQHTFPGWTASLKCIGGVLQLNANSFPSAVCESGSSQLVALVNGGSGNYSYNWQPATWLDDPHSPTPVATPLSNISYTVTVTDGIDTLHSSPVNLTIIPRPSAPVITYNGSMLISDHSTGNQWYINGNLIPGATGQTFSPSSSGDYTATFTDPGNHCESAHSNYITWLITGQAAASRGTSIRVFPNPAKEILNIEIPASFVSSCTVSLLDARGSVVIPEKMFSVNKYDTRKINLDTEKLPAGIYFCRVVTDLNSFTEKVIITK